MRVIRCLLPLLAAACAAADPAARSPVLERSTVDPTASGQMLTLHQDVRGGVSILPYPVDSIWTVLPEVYRRVGIEPALIDPSTKSLGNRSFAATRELGGTSLSKVVRCGLTSLGLPRENSSRINFSVVTALAPAADGQTRVQTRVEAFTRIGGSGSGSIECTSTGTLERLISEGLEEGVVG